MVRTSRGFNQQGTHWGYQANCAIFDFTGNPIVGNNCWCFAATWVLFYNRESRWNRYLQPIHVSNPCPCNEIQGHFAMISWTWNPQKMLQELCVFMCVVHVHVVVWKAKLVSRCCLIWKRKKLKAQRSFFWGCKVKKANRLVQFVISTCASMSSQSVPESRLSLVCELWRWLVKIFPCYHALLGFMALKQGHWHGQPWAYGWRDAFSWTWGLSDCIWSVRLHVHTMAILNSVLFVFQKKFKMLSFEATFPDVIVIASSGAPDLHDLWLTETHLNRNRLFANHSVFCAKRKLLRRIRSGKWSELKKKQRLLQRLGTIHSD